MVPGLILMPNLILMFSSSLKGLCSFGMYMYVEVITRKSLDGEEVLGYLHSSFVLFTFFYLYFLEKFKCVNLLKKVWKCEVNF